MENFIGSYSFTNRYVIAECWKPAMDSGCESGSGQAVCVPPESDWAWTRVETWKRPPGKLNHLLKNGPRLKWFSGRNCGDGPRRGRYPGCRSSPPGALPTPDRFHWDAGYAPGPGSWPHHHFPNPVSLVPPERMMRETCLQGKPEPGIKV